MSKKQTLLRSIFIYFLLGFIGVTVSYANNPYDQKSRSDLEIIKSRNRAIIVGSPIYMTENRKNDKEKPGEKIKRESNKLLERGKK